MSDIFSNTSIVNRALIYVAGAENTELIDDITDQSVDLCNKIRVLMPSCLQEVMEALDWAEAKKYTSLGGQLAHNDPDLLDLGELDWQYAFPLPPDCIVIREQIDQADKNLNYDYEVIGDIFCTNDLSTSDHTSAYIRYTRLITDTAKMSGALQESFVRLLASKIAGILKPQEAKNLQGDYFNYLFGEAAQMNGQRIQPRTNDEKFTLLYPGIGIDLPYPANGVYPWWYPFWYPPPGG